MQTPRPLEVLFLTDFSNASYRTIPAMAQMADELDIRLTLLHVSDGARKTQAAAEAQLRSFFPEAVHYQGSQRIVLCGKVLDAVRQVKSEQPVDLIVAPSSDPLGLPDPWHNSLRAELLSAGCGPVWTIGRAVHSAVLNRRTRNVGCWVDLDSSDKRHISSAFAYASAAGAKLHLLNAMPEIEEGTLASTLFSETPLHADGVADEIQDFLGWVPVRPELHISPGAPKRVVPALARELELDIVFVNKSRAVSQGWTRTSMGAAVNLCPCPVVCTDGVSALWQLKKGRAHIELGKQSKAA